MALILKWVSLTQTANQGSEIRNWFINVWYQDVYLAHKNHIQLSV